MAGLNRAYKRRGNAVALNGAPVLCLDAGSRLSYPGSGTAWTDLSGNANNGTLVNGPTFDSANGGIILLDGINQYATCASSNSFAFGTGDFTLEIMVYHGISGNQYSHLLSLPNQNTFTLKSRETGTFGEIYFYSPSFATYGAGGIPAATASDWVLARNAWNHIIFARNSSVGYGYKNGILKGSKSGFTVNFTQQILNIGSGWGGEYRSKNIGFVRIYNRALTAAEVATNFELLRGRYGI